MGLPHPAVFPRSPQEQPQANVLAAAPRPRAGAFDQGDDAATPDPIARTDPRRLACAGSRSRIATTSDVSADIASAQPELMPAADLAGERAAQLFVSACVQRRPRMPAGAAARRDYQDRRSARAGPCLFLRSAEVGREKSSSRACSADLLLPPLFLLFFYLSPGTTRRRAAVPRGSRGERRRRPRTLASRALATRHAPEMRFRARRGSRS